MFIRDRRSGGLFLRQGGWSLLAEPIQIPGVPELEL